MKDLFICLLLNIAKFGKVTSANFYGDDLSTIKIETKNSEYEISIFRKAKEENKDD
jgi:hypothetical protein